MQDAAALLGDIGRILAGIRRERGLTQEEMAEQLELSTNYLQAIEGGRENLTVRSLVVLANKLDIEVARFFEPPKDRVRRVGRPPRAQ